MNKNGLIEAVAAKAEVKKAEAARILDAALDVVVEAAQRGEGLQLAGFASLTIVEKAAHQAKNPRTGAVIEVPAKKVVKVKPGSRLAL